MEKKTKKNKTKMTNLTMTMNHGKILFFFQPYMKKKTGTPWFWWRKKKEKKTGYFHTTSWFCFVANCWTKKRNGQKNTGCLTQVSSLSRRVEWTKKRAHNAYLFFIELFGQLYNLYCPLFPAMKQKSIFCFVAVLCHCNIV